MRIAALTGAILLSAGALLTGFSQTTHAQTAPAQPAPGERPGRYSMHPGDGGGVVRMDNETGALTHCVKRDGTLTCDPVKVEEGSKELERILKENRDLKADIKRLEDLLANSGPPSPSDDRQARRSPKFELPTEEDVDKALSYMDRMLKKFRDKMTDFEGRGRDSL